MYIVTITATLHIFIHFLGRTNFGEVCATHLCKEVEMLRISVASVTVGVRRASSTILGLPATSCGLPGEVSLCHFTVLYAHFPHLLPNPTYRELQERIGALSGSKLWSWESEVFKTGLNRTMELRF